MMYCGIEQGAKVGQPKIIPMIERLYPDVMRNVLKMRVEKQSFDDISRYVSDEVGIKVSREVLRRWCNTQAESRSAK